MGWTVFAWLGGTLAAIGGAVAGAIKVVTSLADHPKDCSCEPCQARRGRQLNRRYEREEEQRRRLQDIQLRNTLRASLDIVSTRQLAENMLVVSKDGQIYQVDRITRSSPTWTVRLINRATSLPSEIYVPVAQLDYPKWRLRPGWRG